MKAFINEYKFNMVLTAFELAAAALLFAAPAYLGNCVIISEGALLAVWGAFRIWGYFAAKLEKGKHVRGFSAGVLLVLAGILVAVKQNSVHDMVSGAMCMLGAVMFAIGVFKAELAISMLRLSFGSVMWMSISAVFSLAVSALFIFSVFDMTSIPYILAGVSVAICAGLDITAMAVREVPEQETDTAEE